MEYLGDDKIKITAPEGFALSEFASARAVAFCVSDEGTYSKKCGFSVIDVPIAALVDGTVVAPSSGVLPYTQFDNAYSPKVEDNEADVEEVSTNYAVIKRFYIPFYSSSNETLLDSSYVVFFFKPSA